MSAPLVLYSCVTWLAYQINRRYYGDTHYVWCTPFFNPGSRLSQDNAVPPTSSPLEIFRNLTEEIRRGDRHSIKIEQNRLGIQRGADIHLSNGAISKEDHRDIISITSEATFLDFRPLILVIPFHLVSSQIVQVPIKDRASPLSEEYIVSNVARKSFDIVDLQGAL
jgi:hypothetical protein